MMPKEVVTPDNFRKVNEVVLTNIKMKSQMLAGTLKIQKERADFVLYEKPIL